MPTEVKPLNQLVENDCFFLHTEQSRARADAECKSINDFRVALGLEPLTAAQRLEFWRSLMQACIVYAIVGETGERCVMRLDGGKFSIFYDGSISVLYTSDRKSFDDRIAEMRKARKQIEDEQQAMQRAHSKKENTKQLQMT